MVFWTSAYFVSAALLHLHTSTTMSKYNKQSGAKRRAEQKDNEAMINCGLLESKNWQRCSNIFLHQLCHRHQRRTELFDQTETSQTMELAALDEKQRLQS